MSHDTLASALKPEILQAKARAHQNEYRAGRFEALASVARRLAETAPNRETFLKECGL